MSSEIGIGPGTSHVGHDLRHADLVGKVLFECDLRGANLYNASISLTCATFDGVILSSVQVALLLRLISLANVNQAWKEGLRVLIESVVGKAQNEALSRYLAVHIRS